MLALGQAGLLFWSQCKIYEILWSWNEFLWIRLICVYGLIDLVSVRGLEIDLIGVGDFTRVNCQSGRLYLLSR